MLAAGGDRERRRDEHVALVVLVGEALGEQALRRTDEEDRLLEPVAAPDEADMSPFTRRTDTPIHLARTATSPPDIVPDAEATVAALPFV